MSSALYADPFLTVVLIVAAFAVTFGILKALIILARFARRSTTTVGVLRSVRKKGARVYGTIEYSLGDERVITTEVSGIPNTKKEGDTVYITHLNKEPTKVVYDTLGNQIAKIIAYLFILVLLFGLSPLSGEYGSPILRGAVLLLFATVALWFVFVTIANRRRNRNFLPKGTKRYLPTQATVVGIEAHERMYKISLAYTTHPITLNPTFSVSSEYSELEVGDEITLNINPDGVLAPAESSSNEAENLLAVPSRVTKVWQTSKRKYAKFMMDVPSTKVQSDITIDSPTPYQLHSTIEVFYNPLLVKKVKTKYGRMSIRKLAIILAPLLLIALSFLFTFSEQLNTSQEVVRRIGLILITLLEIAEGIVCLLPLILYRLRYQVRGVPTLATIREVSDAEKTLTISYSYPILSGDEYSAVKTYRFRKRRYALSHLQSGTLPVIYDSHHPTKVILQGQNTIPRRIGRVLLFLVGLVFIFVAPILNFLYL